MDSYGWLSIFPPLLAIFLAIKTKHVYILDSTSAPKCIIIPFNFYAFLAIFLVLAVILSGKDIGPMKKAEKRVLEEGKLLRDGAEPLISDDVVMMQEKPGVPPRAINMILPVATMVLMMPVVLIITGIGFVL